MTAASTTVADFATTVDVTGTTCPSCAKPAGRVFYEVNGIPTHQVRLVHTYDEAIHCPKGDVRLAFCRGCGFIWNTAFDPTLVEYRDDYESTQAVSPTFNRFHKNLARNLMIRYSLTGKEVLEIGCGQGEFLRLLRELGVRHAFGFDPALRGAAEAPAGVTLIKNWYSEAYQHLRPDFVMTKMVMEHIPDPGRFLTMLRRAIGDRPEVIALAMVPEVTRILTLRAFWDIYYEHCSYFSLGSLARAFRSAGFDVVDLWSDYGDQYALIDAYPRTAAGAGAPLAAEESPEELAALTDDFATNVGALQVGWRNWLKEQRDRGRRVVLWGGGSKGVAFLTTLGVRDEIEFAVDINPRRRGTFIAGTGQRIVTPDFLQRYRPDEVVIMSPIYRDEIAADLAAMGLAPRLVSVEDQLTGRDPATGGSS